MAVLRVKAGAEKGKIYELAEDNILLGRDRSGTIQVLDQGASRQHAEVFQIGELFFIRDLESRNGTYVNSEKVKEVVLRFGDQIQIGSTVLVFEDQMARFQDSAMIMIDDAAGAKAPKPSSTLQMRLTETLGGAPSVEDKKETAESRRLSALLAIANTIGSERNLSKIITQAAAQLGKVMDADNVFIFHVTPKSSGNEQGDEITDFELLGRYDRSDELQSEGVSKTIIRDCLDSGHAVLTSDAGLDSRYNAMASVVMQRIRSVICVPITGLGRNIGVVYVSNSQRSEAFNSEDLEVASAVAVQLGTTIQLLQLIHQSEKIFRNSIRTVVAATEMRDPFSKGRAERLAAVSLAIAKELGWSTHDCRNAWLAGMLHDIGSIPLSDRDREAQFTLDTRRNHYASELLKEMPGLEEVLPAITQQKERWDGTGGPEGLKGEDIHPIAQVLGLAYAFDELLHDPEAAVAKPGTPKPSEKEVLMKVMQSAGKAFKADLVKALMMAYRKGKLFNEEAHFFEIPG